MATRQEDTPDEGMVRQFGAGVQPHEEACRVLLGDGRQDRVGAWWSVSREGSS